MVENPSVVDETLLRDVTIPIVCTFGALRAVDHILLELAQQARIPIRYSGDLDRAGISIAENVRERYGGVLWHMDSGTFKDAHEAGPLTTVPESAPVINGPSEVIFIPPIPLTWQSTNDTQNLPAKVVFQEHPLILDRLLGPDENDPLPLPPIC